MNLCDIKEKLDFSKKFSNLTRRLKKNKLLSYWYDVMAEDLYFDVLPKEVSNSDYFKTDFWYRRREDLHSRSSRIAQCSRYWSCDYYRLQGVVDLMKVNLCHDRFCDNCQNALAVQRSNKYEPLLMKLTEDFDIYHVILTVPNVTLVDLYKTLDRMFSAYKRLCQFMDGRKFVHNVDFLQVGYCGSIRALEITKNKKKGTFHPHFHCLWLVRKNYNKGIVRGEHINLYSFKKNNTHIAGSAAVRKFSDFEILLQKVWRLLYDGVEVNYSNLQEMKLGYSCMIANARGRYKEVFKYATKGLLSADPSADPIDQYADFVQLFAILYRRRLLQGYGCLYRLKFNDRVDQSADNDDVYLDCIKKLHELENPISFHADLEYLQGSVGKDRNITFISRKNISALVANDE